jgi:hypothetical protein
MFVFHFCWSAILMWILRDARAGFKQLDQKYTGRRPTARADAAA